MARSSAAAAIPALILSASLALAQSGAPDPAKLRVAAEAFDAGAVALRQNEHALAASHFEAADAAVPSAKALRLAMRARAAAGQGSRAATLAAQALARYPGDAETEKLANETLARFAPRLHRLEVSCASPCVLAVGTRAVPGRATTRWTIYLDPGRDTVGASFFGNAVVQRAIDAKEGGSSEVRFEPPDPVAPPSAPFAVLGPKPSSSPREEKPTAAPEERPRAAPPRAKDEPAPEEAAPRRGGLPPFVFIGGAIVTAALGGVTIWSAVDTQTNPGPDAVRAQCAGQGEACPAYQDGLAQQLRTNVLIGATAGTAALTLVVGVFFTDWGGGADASASSRARLVPVAVATEGGALVGAAGRF